MGTAQCWGALILQHKEELINANEHVKSFDALSQVKATETNIEVLIYANLVQIICDPWGIVDLYFV